MKRVEHQGHAPAAADASNYQLKHRVFLRETGRLLPDMLPLHEITRVLDAQCRSGAWMVDVAKTYPEMQLTGLDPNPEMIAIAQSDLHAAGTWNVDLKLGSPRHDLPCAPASFDFVQLMLGSTMIDPGEWPDAVLRLKNVLRPGGWIHLLDFEPGPTSSPSLDTMLALLVQAKVIQGRTISPDGLSFTSAVLFPQLLSNSGFYDIHYTLYPINLGGWNNIMGRSYLTTMLSPENRLFHFLLDSEMIALADLKQLVARIRYELHDIDFCGTGMLVSATASKPLSL